MKTIIFTETDFYQEVPPALRRNYQHLGGHVYALRPEYMTLEIDRLPKWLSVPQYAAFRRKIGPYYRLVTRGFNVEAVALMELIPNISYGIKRQITSPVTVKGIKLTEAEFWQLPPAEKSKYAKIRKGFQIFYVKKTAPARKQVAVRPTAIRQPTVGIKKIPIGRWVETR